MQWQDGARPAAAQIKTTSARAAAAEVHPYCGLWHRIPCRAPWKPCSTPQSLAWRPLEVTRPVVVLLEPRHTSMLLVDSATAADTALLGRCPSASKALLMARTHCLGVPHTATWCCPLPETGRRALSAFCFRQGGNQIAVYGTLAYVCDMSLRMDWISRSVREKKIRFRVQSQPPPAPVVGYRERAAADVLVR